MLKKVLFVVTEDWFFVSHFQPMARAITRLGFDVVVVARPSPAARKIADLGYRLVPNEIGRSAISPTGVARSILALRRIIAEEQPDVVHAVALPPVVVAALATLGNNIKVVLAPTGLGHLWLSHSATAIAAKKAVQFLIWTIAKRRSVVFVFENDEDPVEFGLDPADTSKITLVGGAGVSAIEFLPTVPPSTPPMRVAIVARMTTAKGIAPAVEAVRRLRESGRDIRLDLFGDPDPSSGASISEGALRQWSAMEGIVWHGHIDAPSAVWAKSHVAVLLSWREGLPRSLVEAMACGRPIVATDVAGCRTLVTDGVEGFLVPVDSVEHTESALARLYDDVELRIKMGLAARSRFESQFTDAAVELSITGLYQRLSRR